MLKLISKNNYLFVKDSYGNISSGFANEFHFQEQPDGKFDLKFDGSSQLLADGFEFSDFQDETNTPFASAEGLRDFYTLKSGSSSNLSGISTIAKQQEIIDLLKFKKNAGNVSKSVSNITNVVSTILTANANRKKIIFENASTQRVFVCYGQNATTTNYSFSLSQNEKFIEETPFVGLITAITQATNSNLQITELS